MGGGPSGVQGLGSEVKSGCVVQLLELRQQSRTVARPAGSQAAHGLSHEAAFWGWVWWQRALDSGPSAFTRPPAARLRGHAVYWSALSLRSGRGR